MGPTESSEIIGCLLQLRWIQQYSGEWIQIAIGCLPYSYSEYSGPNSTLVSKFKLLLDAPLQLDLRLRWIQQHSGESIQIVIGCFLLLGGESVPLYKTGPRPLVSQATCSFSKHKITSCEA